MVITSLELLWVGPTNEDKLGRNLELRLVHLLARGPGREDVPVE